MNPFKKTGLIVGGTLLFSSTSCVEPNEPGPRTDTGPNTDTGVRADSGSEDSGLAFDASVDDSGPLLDTGAPPPRDSGVSPRDTGVSPRDTGTPERAPTNGQECERRGAAYCNRGQALYWCTGTHWQRTDNYNCRQGSCEPSGRDTNYGRAVCNQPESGARCDRQRQAWCDEQLQPQMQCQGAWYEANNGLCGRCEVGQDGYLETMCATPGFVGIAQANRQRLPGQSLRHI